MSTSMVAKHSRGKAINDPIFGASAACTLAAQQHGANAVTNATMGVIMDDNGNLAKLPTVERVFRELAMEDYIQYAPISGLPSYLESVADIVFTDSRPDAYIGAVATAGGTGALRHAVANYAEHGDAILTSDWFWGTYRLIAEECGSTLETFTLFDENNLFNHKSFSQKVSDLLTRQDSLLIILNNPAHNPTGFNLTDEDWDSVLTVVGDYAKKGKKISLVVDIAYIDFGGEKYKVRRFMRKFSTLNENIITLIAFSMSKAYTFYGQRTGALIAVSSSQAVVDEFKDVMQYTSRATWSNINRGAMTLLTKIQQDKTAYETYEKERDALYRLVQERGNIFMAEAKECGLNALPYKGGFFLAIPSSNPEAVCEKLHDDLIFAVPLKRGVRVAACSVPATKMVGVAQKVKNAMDAIEG